MDRRKSLLLLGAAGVVAVAGRWLDGQAEARSEFLRENGFPYDAFDALPEAVLRVGGSSIHVAFAPGGLSLKKSQILDWISHAATAVSAYYGHFPVPSVRVLIVPVGGYGVEGGTTWGYRGAAVRMLLGADCDVDGLTRDWMMTHEFVHTALPDVSTRYAWLSEGLAVYVEPIARVQAGYLAAKSIWADMLRDMPKGLPALGDKGLDDTSSWSSTYWGGALFCLRADLGIRRGTKNRHGLQNAMRGVLAAGGNHEVDWPLRKILATADHAIGLSVMSDLYDRVRAKPDPFDLNALWRKLGIEVTEAGLRFDNDAPWAAERIAITERPAAG